MYIVNRVCSFDPNIDCVKFDSYKEAIQYLNWSYDKELDKNKELLNIEECCKYIDKGYAKITLTVMGHIEFVLSKVNNPDPEFKEYYKSLKGDE